MLVSPFSGHGWPFPECAGGPNRSDSVAFVLGYRKWKLQDIVYVVKWVGSAATLALYAPPHRFWVRAGIVAAVILGGGYIIRGMITLQVGEAPHPQGESSKELRNAGLYIGWLERSSF